MTINKTQSMKETTFVPKTEISQKPKQAESLKKETTASKDLLILSEAAKSLMAKAPTKNSMEEANESKATQISENESAE